MKEIISGFVKKQKIATVCCLDKDENPYCFNCFYAFDDKNFLLYFKSSSSSLHAKFLTAGAPVAGTILPDKINALAVRGIQFTGLVLTESHSAGAFTKYHKKYPFALAMPGEVTMIRLASMKMTDNTKGFGKKICWNREEETVPVEETQAGIFLG